jgi:hypothetical protein
MRFPNFSSQSGADGPGEGDDPFRGWRESDLADEVVAYFSGELIRHYATAGRPSPPWAVVNRVAHADRSELGRIVEGDAAGVSPPTWATTERFLAARILAQAPTPEALTRLQNTVLVPVELGLIERSRIDRPGADEILDAALEALDTYHPG